MFQVNDVITYGTTGVCQIAGIEEKNIGGTRKDYYVLKPVADPGATIFAPVDHPYSLKKMRRLLSEVEINNLIDSMPDEDMQWIENETVRKEQFKAILAEGDHLGLIKMIKAIYIHKKEREAEGKRLHLSDERLFKDAEQILYNEFQYVLKLKDKEDLLAYILTGIDP